MRGRAAGLCLSAWFRRDWYMSPWTPWMGAALAEAGRTPAHGDVAVGAVLFDPQGHPAATERNRRQELRDPHRPRRNAGAVGRRPARREVAVGRIHAGSHAGALRHVRGSCDDGSAGTQRTTRLRMAGSLNGIPNVSLWYRSEVFPGYASFRQRSGGRVSRASSSRGKLQSGLRLDGGSTQIVCELEVCRP